VSLTADQAIAGGKGDKPQGPDVRFFLETILAGGPMEAKKIEEIAARRGISINQLNKMKTRLGVQSKQVGGFGSAGHWEWYFPADDPNSEI
jgi:hypothetical protein